MEPLYEWCIAKMQPFLHTNPDSKIHGANMGPIWDRQVPGGPHVGPMNFAIWECITTRHGDVILIESIKTTSMEDVSTGVQE